MNAPVCGVARSPFMGMRPEDMKPAPAGVPIASLQPIAGGLLLCRVNGDFLARESWASPTQLGDVIEWYDVPKDRDVLRGVLSIAAVYFLGPGYFALEGATLIAANIVAQLAINSLLPPTSPTTPARPGATGDAFSTSLNGNEARLDSPIWKVCGRREINPPYACRPYYEYRANPDEEDPHLDNVQYFFALFAVGVGDHDVIAKIGNTPITRFADVVRAQYLPPGTQPAEVLANVTTAVEVAGQVLESSRYVGGFAACAARRTCVAIGVDVAATRGLGKEGALTVSWRVEWRPINDFGQVLGPWTVLANESRTAFTSTPQRWSNRYEIDSDSPQRAEVRVVRTDVQDTDPTALHEIAWIGLRAYLAEPAPLNAEAAHFEVVMRASSQLSGQSSQDLRLIVKAHARSLDADLEWQPAAFTRNPIWWLLDLATSTTWGMGKPDSRVDLQSFRDLAVIADARQDRFDYVFDSTVNAWDAMQLIARAVRARVFRRNGVISIARDGAVDIPVTAFTPRNCVGSVQLLERTRQRNSPDGIVIEYQDHRTNEWTAIECPMPGLELSDMRNPVIKRLEGVIGETHAHREGLYEAAVLAYRTRTANFTTEMEAMLPAYLSPVWLQPDAFGYGQAGDVVDFDAGSLVMTLSEPIDFSAGTIYLTLVRDDGTLTTPAPITAGATPNEVILPAAPDFALVLDDARRERPKFIVGTATGAREIALVRAISDGGKSDDGAQLFALTAEIDDERVHEADVALLPGPGDEQDPIGDPDDSADEADDTLIVIRVLDKWVQAAVFTPAGTRTTDIVATYRLRNDGIVELIATSGSANAYGGAGSTLGVQSGEWSLFGALEVADAGLYEARATLVGVDYSQSVAAESLGGTLDAWLNLGTTREWSLTSPYVSDANDRRNSYRLLIEIREAASGIVQDSAAVRLTTEGIDVSGD